MAQALVEFNYDAQESDELTIRKGDVITDVIFNSKGWWEGTLSKDGKRGMFPDNFVKLMSDPNGLASSHTSAGRKCKVLFSYKPANEDELEIQVGDIIDVISEVEEGWWKGSLKNRVGVFPSNFVAELTNVGETREASQRKPKISHDESVKVFSAGVQDQASSTPHVALKTTPMVNETSPTEVPVLPPKPVKEICKVIFNYEAANPDELTLQEGEIITLITRDGQDPGWWKGEYKGKVGLFPDNFVQLINTSEETSPIPKPDRPSKALTTSKSKDTINKMATSSMSNIASISRKYSDNVRPDEKVNHPLLSKKPVLPPPPLKKPQRSSSDLAKSPTAPNLLSTKHADTSPTILSTTLKSPTNQQTSGSTTTTTIKSSSNSENITVNSSSSAVTSKRSVVQKTTSDSLDGALWSKSGSYTVTTESFSSSHNNTSSTVITSPGSTDDDLDLVGRAAMLTHPTASRAKAPKRRPPSSVYSGTENNSGEEGPEGNAPTLSTSASTTAVTTMLNGDAESHSEKASTNKVPWVEELKLNQAKKSMQAGNKTRVMIGGTESTSSTVQSITTSVSSTNISSATTSSLDTAKPVTAPNISGVTLRSHQSSSGNSSVTPAQRPQSMVSSLRSPSNESTITIPVKRLHELMDKITMLGMQCDSQFGTLSRTVKDLAAELDKEKQRTSIMQQEIEKLKDLVTQV